MEVFKTIYFDVCSTVGKKNQRKKMKICQISLLMLPEKTGLILRILIFSYPVEPELASEEDTYPFISKHHYLEQIC